MAESDPPPPTDAEGDAARMAQEEPATAPGGGQESAPPPASVGRCRIGAELARGGMGIIYHGWDTDLGRDLAVKVLLSEHAGSRELRWRFLREARITSRLQHPGIVPVYELGEFPDGRPFFTMRLVQGRSLADHLARRASSPTEGLPALLKVFEQVCQAVAYAHHARVVHRDLKPSNIMVAEFGVINVMDWGVARELDAADAAPATGQDVGETPAPGRTESGRVLGTPAYMPPEQARAEPVDERADVFGLGAILCEILTGQPPYGCLDGRQAHRRAVRGDVGAALAALAACHAERDLADLARRCLSPAAEGRPANAGEVAQAMTAYMESSLRRAERDLARFFDLSLDLFCLAGFDGHFRRINPNFSRVLGHPDEAMLRSPFIDFVHPDDHPGTRAAMEQLAQGLPLVRFRNRYRDAAGGYRWFEWTAKAIPEEDLIFAVARDVTGPPGDPLQVFQPAQPIPPS